MTPDQSSDRGFTLVEALVALVVLASVVAAFQSGLRAGFSGLRVVRQEAAAVSFAQSKLAATGIETPLAPGEASGTAPGGLSWRTEIAPFTLAAARTDTDFESDRAQRSAKAPLWRVAVTVSWRDRPARRPRSLTLTTLKLGAQP